ncbi:MAG: hypothetical protein JNN33_02655 [Rhodospirillaceae bacterium]|jgi:hypothetical protein|nr:hypothetical protein [Rhodospirillaceae bacterium]
MVGLGLLAVALLFGAANIWFWIIDAPGGGISLLDVWVKVSARSLGGTQYVIEHYTWPPIWQGIHVLLIQPAWLITGAVALVCIGLGRKWEE